MIRLGMLDFDTSHVVAFAQRLNHQGIPQTQWVDGARVVIGCPGTSELAPQRIPGYVDEIKKIGIPLVDNPGDMIGKIDGLLLCSLEGGAHLEHARPFLEKGIPLFIDKPFTCGRKDAVAIMDLARKHNTAVFSSSSLRYAEEVVKALAETPAQDRVGAATWGPASLSEMAGKNPGLYHYGIHAAEILFTLMGPGCARVQAVYQKETDQVTGTWSDGRIGTLRGLRAGNQGFGFSLFGKKSIRSQSVGTGTIYRELLKQIVLFFQTRKSPVPPAETIELMAFLEAANSSAANHGAMVEIKP